LNLVPDITIVCSLVTQKSAGKKSSPLFKTLPFNYITPQLDMLVLSTLHNLLSQVLFLPHLHTAVLLTPAGQLVSVATDPARPKDEIRIIVGLAGEVWQETREQGFGMVDSEVIRDISYWSMVDWRRYIQKLGRILVLPVDDAPEALPPPQTQPQPQPSQALEEEDHQPLMLLALNSTTAVDWDELQTKVSDSSFFASSIPRRLP
jgi:hypothetical protein